MMLYLRQWLAGLVIMLALPVNALLAEDVNVTRLEDSAFRDVWHVLLKEAQIQPRFVEATLDDVRRMFVRGDVLLACCAIKEWRNRPEERAVQLWTDPIFYTVDRLVLQTGRKYALPNPLDLRAYRVAVTKGYAYRHDELFGDRIEADTIGGAMVLVAQGQADLAIVNHQEFRRRQAIHARPLVLGPEHDKLLLHARVHKSRPDLHAKLNHAIRRLKASGRIAVLTGGRLRGP